MNSERALLLQCLKDFCHHQKTEKFSDEVDWERFEKLLQSQSLGGLVYHQCEKWIPRHFRHFLLQEAYFSVNRQILFEEIAKGLTERCIPFICMKGSVLREYYPVKELRTMGDIDFIIHTEDREAVDSMMCSDLCYNKFVDNHAVWTYYIKDYQIEVHDHMFYEHLTNDFDYQSYFDNIWHHKRYGSVFGYTLEYLYIPEPDTHFLYLMTHTAKHILNKGSGFRPYLDMVLMCQSNDLDWQYLEKELANICLLDFTKTCFALCEEWFDVKMPLEHGKIDPVFLKQITDKTFHDGIFGLDNEQNAGAHTAKEIERSKGNYLLGSLMIIIRLLFPPYRDMQLIPWYSFVDGRPWLMPIAWVYRWFYCITHKLKSSFQKLSEPVRLRKTIKQREIYIKDWGL
ncbi:MAG: nucleotidyltransferase family protein [Solobacterium sp.]|nr:nucleotidyltransferase family protein [Solobacterium sp.]